jgi:hypothetical protein
MSSWLFGYLSTGYIFMAWYLFKHRDNFILYLLPLEGVIKLPPSGVEILRVSSRRLL